MPDIHTKEEAYLFEPEQMKILLESLQKEDLAAATAIATAVSENQRYWHVEGTCSAVPIRF
jgi:hypothetical protein